MAWREERIGRLWASVSFVGFVADGELGIELGATSCNVAAWVCSRISLGPGSFVEYVAERSARSNWSHRGTTRETCRCGAF